MLSGLSIIGSSRGTKTANGSRAWSPLTGQTLPETFYVAGPDEIDRAVELATQAAPVFSSLSAAQRAGFLEAIAAEIMAIGPVLLERANLETGLPEARLSGERDRTVNQLKLFAALLREGSRVDAVIDTALPDRKPLPRTDLRTMKVAIGPVAVFAASNFPLAFSTAGGDTAAALAAGCPVIVKAHGSHPGTNELIATAIQKAALDCGMPEGVFSSLNGEGAVLGQQLARDERIKAIGFTGSFKAGMALFHTATKERKEPIPVYAEMSSINPVLLLPAAIQKDPVTLASQLAGSITLGVGQFCTNPGLLFLLEDEHTDTFVNALTDALNKATAGVMLNRSICKSYYSNRSHIKGIAGVKALLEGADETDNCKGTAALYEVNAADFLKQPALQEEVFGPASLLVRCDSVETMLQAIYHMQGQLTGTVFGELPELDGFRDCITALQNRVGRLIFNQVPTGVEVCHAMVHGGPFPATTDSRSTSVGAASIERFLRSVCWQNCPADFLPEALQDSNPLAIMRKINGVFTRDAITS